MSDEELRDELMTLLVAGHETTATALAWAHRAAACATPASMERLRAEIDAGEDAYLDAVVKETLRLRPVLPIVLRRLKEPMEIGGHMLPAGVTVAPCIYLVHRRPDSTRTRAPSGPSASSSQPPGTYTWIPFGGGMRRCLGASFALFEMKAVLSAVLSRVALRTADPRPERPVRRAVTLVPGNGAEVISEPLHGVRSPASRMVAAA